MIAAFASFAFILRPGLSWRQAGRWQKPKDRVNLRLQISNLKSQISNLKSQISNLKSQISNLKSQILVRQVALGASETFQIGLAPYRLLK
jgi:hypothetical protein